MAIRAGGGSNTGAGKPGIWGSNTVAGNPRLWGSNTVAAWLTAFWNPKLRQRRILCYANIVKAESRRKQMNLFFLPRRILCYANIANKIIKVAS